jgi:choline kinase
VRPGTGPRAIILAAGSGSRLAPLTDDRPKALVEIHGRPILRYTMDNFIAQGVSDLCIVTGYRAEAFLGADLPPARRFHNPRFAETNMLASLFCAEAALEGEVAVSYGDIVYEPGVLEKLLSDESDISVVVDDGWLEQWKLRNENPLLDAETLRIDADGYIVEIGDKPVDYGRIESQYIGLLKFSPRGLGLLKEAYHALERADDGEAVLRGRPFGKLYFTDMLQFLADRNPRTVKAVRIRKGWFEVDTVRDYEIFNARLPAKNAFCDLTSIPGASRSGLL